LFLGVVMRFFLIIALLTFTGCATTESLEKNYADINREDGVNRDEAALIAKKWLVESQYEGDFQVIAPVVTTFEQDWQVAFLYKSVNYYEKVLNVYVDKKTGDIKGQNVRQKDTPPVTKDPWDTFNKNSSLPVSGQ
jgi:hypothetical protein